MSDELLPKQEDWRVYLVEQNGSPPTLKGLARVQASCEETALINAAEAEEKVREEAAKGKRLVALPVASTEGRKLDIRFYVTVAREGS